MAVQYHTSAVLQNQCPGRVQACKYTYLNKVPFKKVNLNVTLVPLIFSQFYNIQNTADLRLYTMYELYSIEYFDYTTFSEYGIKSFGYIFDIW